VPGAALSRPRRPFDVVACAASLGALHAFTEVLGALPAYFPVPVVLLAHRSATTDDQFVGLLERRCALPVRLASANERLGARGIWVMPSTHPIVVGPSRRFADPAVGGRPSADLLFASLAQAFGARVVAAVLSGRLSDGTSGVSAVKRAGGRVLVEDPTTARATAMPTAALATGCVDFVLPLSHIAAAVITLTMAPGAAEMFRVPAATWARTA
jgi:two-component system chemotaxis response regulator CheB